ncbi:MAG TPA: class I SAM-dependent methyltransferase [Thermoanaerobaculia bacterium]
MSAKNSLAFRAGWFLRSRPILLRRWLRVKLADWRGAASTRKAREQWNPDAFPSEMNDFFWTRSRVVREYLHEMASGDPRCDWVTWMTHRYAVKPGLSVLVLGCGDGWLERVLAGSGRVERIIGVDFSPEAVARASENAARAGLSGKVRHQVVDLERDALPSGPYDLVFAHDVIHHLRELDRFFDRVAKELAPGGVLLFCEYVGPDRFQYDRKRREIIDEFLRALPEKYRRLPRTGGLATEGVRTDPGELARRDPSEAVRSSEILPAVRRRMRVLEEIPYGGSILNPLLHEIIVNFEDGNEADEAILRQLCAAEKILIRTGAIPSDYVIGAAGRK